MVLWFGAMARMYALLIVPFVIAIAPDARIGRHAVTVHERPS